jgi:hypothetical protein
LSILQLLAGADDKDIQRMALTGLLQAGQPGKRAKGIRGFLDETDDSPVSQSLRQIQEFMNTPVEREVTQPGIPARPVTGSAALPGQAAVEPGAAGVVGTPPPSATTGPSTAASAIRGGPVQPPQVSASAGQLGAFPPTPMVSRTVSEPRRAFLSDAEQRGHLEQETLRAKVTEARRLFPELSEDDLAMAIFPSLSTGRGRGRTRFQQGRFAVLPDGRIEQTTFDPETGQQLISDPDTGALVPVPAGTAFTSAASLSFGDIVDIEAQRTFGKPAIALNPIELAQVQDAANTRLRGERIRTAGGTAEASVLGREAGEQQTRVPESVATAQGLPFGTLIGDLRGIVPVSVDQRERKEAALAVMPDLMRIEELIPEVFPSGTGLRGGLEANRALLVGRITRSPNLARLQSVVNAAVSNMARVRAAESGRLTEQDVDRAFTTLVNLQASLLNGDTQESALARMEEARVAIQRVIDNIKLPADQLRERQEGAGVGLPPLGVNPNIVSPDALSPF